MHVAELCRCGMPYDEIQSIPTETTAFAAYIPRDSNRVFVDPDAISHVLDYSEAEEQLLDTTGATIKLSTNGEPRMLISTEGELKYIETTKVFSDKLLCKINSCTVELQALFDSLIKKESDLIELYQSLADLTPKQTEQSSIPLGIEKIQQDQVQCKYNTICNYNRYNWVDFHVQIFPF